jgi:branched-chain amino acid transport system substrate-binding protein
MRKSGKRITTALGIVATVVLAACSSTPSAGGGGGGGDGAVVKIGFIAERAGTYSDIGIPSYNGTKMAVDSVNSDGGFKIGGTTYKFQLIVCDDNSDQTLVAQCADKLVHDDKVKFLFGAIGDFAPIVAKIADPAGVMFFTPASAATPLLPSTKNMIITLPSLNLNAQIAVSAITQIMPKVNRVALLVDNSLDNTTIAPVIISDMKKAGLDVVTHQVFPVGATDVSGQLTKIRSYHPDLLYIGWTAAEAAVILQQAAQLNVTPAVATWAIGCEQAVASNFPGTYLGNPETPLDVDYSTSAKAVTFRTEYTDQFHPAAGTNLSYALLNYDFIGLLAQAMTKAGSQSNIASVLSAVQSINYDGLYGPMRIVDRQVVFGLDFCTATNGKVTSVTHVNPPSQ